jgi:alkanesulfonate monooxygenase SsuD/methylene tetrahydromethanopterin reductase-like flavin-dependent oxidoreductase (luciferase family)
MDIGIGLPNTITDVTGEKLTEWARRADDAGFSTLGTIDRIVYENYEPLLALTVAAAVTKRIRLTTSVLLAPPRISATVLAKQTATLQHLSGGRFVLGAAIGGRDDDYEAAGVPMSERGTRFEAMVDELKAIWSHTAEGAKAGIGPDVSANPPKLIVGGGADVVYRRAAENEGWIMGGGTPEAFVEGKEKLTAAWREAGREGEPYAGALAYYSLGPDAQANAENQIGRYYEFLGDYQQMVVDGAAKDEDTVRGYVRAFTDAGCDELILFPASSDPEQVDLLAAATLA